MNHVSAIVKSWGGGSSVGLSVELWLLVLVTNHLDECEGILMEGTTSGGVEVCYGGDEMWRVGMVLCISTFGLHFGVLGGYLGGAMVFQRSECLLCVCR